MMQAEGATMSKLSIIIAAPCLCLALGGCLGDRAIVAGAVDSVGLVAAAGSSAQGAQLNLGFKGAKFALVPVENKKGQVLRLKDCKGKEKSFSVYARLTADGSASVGSTLGGNIRQVLAVGPAAELWAKAESGITNAEIKDAQAKGFVSDCIATNNG